MRSWVIALWRRVRALVLRARLERDLDEEIAFHRGMLAERGQAGRKFGNELRLREAAREAWMFTWLESLGQDLRFGLRLLRKFPSFAAVAILTMALAIGANTAIFAAVNGIVLQPLPYPNASRLVTVGRFRQIGYGITRGEIATIKQMCPAIERAAPYDEDFGAVSFPSISLQRDVTGVSGDFFSILGVKPLLGRAIGSADTQSGGDRIAVLSYRLWMDAFGGDPRALGHTVSVTVDAPQPYRIVGVMPKQFDVDGGEGAWVPLPGSDDAEALVAMLRMNASRTELEAQLRAASARFAAGYSVRARAEGKPGVIIGSLKQEIPLTTSHPLWVLLGAVGCVLLMACVNLSALLLARGWVRQHEIATRRVLGASGFRIARQLFSESCLLAVAGGALGMLFSLWGIHLLRALAPPGTPRVDYIGFDAWVFWFALGLTLLAALLFGLAPAWQAALQRRGDHLTPALSGALGGPGGRQRHALRLALIVSEIALSVILMTGGVLMGRSLYKLEHLNTGMRLDHVITMPVQLGDAVCGQGQPSRCGLAAANILDQVRALPGVRSAAVSRSANPTQGDWMVSGFSYPGGPVGQGLYVEGSAENLLTGLVGRSDISPGFFSTLGMNLLQGRSFDTGDLAAARARFAFWQSPAGQRAGKQARQSGHCSPQDESVAIVSATFARTYISGDPIGKHFYTCQGESSVYWTKIVGVVADVHDHSLDRLAPPLGYYEPDLGGSQWSLIARTAADPMAMVAAMKRIVRAGDPDAHVSGVATLNQIIAASAAGSRFDTALLASFGVIGLLLAIIGIYGVMSYSVAQRTREVGVRVALGAQPGDIVRLVLGQGAAVALAGIALGLGGALEITRLLRHLLYSVTPTDPATFAGVALLMLAAALAACYIPARRALRVDPATALRSE